MFHDVVKIFFMGQIAAEYAVEATKKNFEQLCEKAREYQNKAVEEYKNFKLDEKVQQVFREKLTEFRQHSKEFESLCESLSKLLIETSEPQRRLITTNSRR